ncbi:MAG: exodeoxyribonuclease VII large subunit [Candidatus Marinimicrobia bacterium]|nr:exodeoxyribonuclease VII large subunit [Candidatus Neomarinimicrobiota bacterium]
MDFELVQKLKGWRSSIARKEGVELYRVLSNATIDSIAELKPKTKEELLEVKGIKEKKFQKYGADILMLVNKSSESKNKTDFFEEEETQDDENEIGVYSVSRYLDILNFQLKKTGARIRGEISSLDIRDTYLFFSIKDTKDGSVLSCFMWKRDYDLCGVGLEIGMEIIVDGFPEVYKPGGRLSLKVSTIELVGEGALKKAYDELKGKLEKEGLFLPENKKIIPEFPKKIGLITSETGAVIHDFLNNLGSHGYQIKFFDSRVEGQIAVHNLLSAIKYFSSQDIDVLVIIRGGGSLESLQAFNNETLVREVASFKTPVICGIGHDKDVPLTSMVADKMVSTPTAVTKILDETWDSALGKVNLFEKEIIGRYQKMISDTKFYLEELSGKLFGWFNYILKKFENLRQDLITIVTKIGYRLKDTRRTLVDFSNFLVNTSQKMVEEKCAFLDNIEKQLKIFDPIRQLRLGYSIISLGKKIIKSTKEVAVGDSVDIRVSDGKISSEVKNIINK